MPKISSSRQIERHHVGSERQAQHARAGLAGLHAGPARARAATRNAAPRHVEPR